jgi:2Fe-2S ferredoxin
MPKVNYRTTASIHLAVEVPAGENVMRGALYNGVEGIAGECGGALACATCHCYVSPEWLGLMPPISVEEEEMLACTAAERRSNSRLSCQIVMNDALDGLIVDLPVRQY